MRVRAHVFVVYVTTYKFFGQTSRFFIANIWDFKCQVFLSVWDRNTETKNMNTEGIPTAVPTSK